MSGSTVKAHTLASGVPGAPLVVFAHGLEDSWSSWLPLAAELDPDWRLVALDLPWRPANDYRWRTRPAGQWLAEGLDLLGAVPDTLVAHSFGANAALELLCALDPRPGRAAALVCPMYRPPHHPVTWRMFDRSRSTFVQHIRDGVRARMGVRAESTDPGVLETMMDLALDRVGPSGFFAVFEQFAASADLPLGNVGLPTLVLAGGADPALSREAATTLAGGMPGAEIRIHHDYDHFCHIRHARGVAAQVADLVDTARATTRTAGELR
ncbi:alpha/beta fold hydrolase [Streptosporangium sp. NPDC000396]|uniref:alpha/beta fold hydrolase n=1 Tax=Streptosporangium sp. NPDC000396 TaxID=3366185 RepID=UPI0036BE0D42